MLDFRLSTFIFQIINFFLLLAALTWFLYRPLRRVMKEREADIAAKLHDADERAKKADMERQQLTVELQHAKTEAEQLLAGARSEAAAIRERLVEQARGEATQILEGAKQRIQEQELAAQERLQAQIGGTAVAVAGNLVQQAVGPRFHAELVQQFVNGTHLETHHVALLQQALSQTDGRLAVEVAYPPSDEQQEQITTALADTLSRDKETLKPDFRIEPALVAGLRILVGTVAVDLSLRRTLDTLSKTVSRSANGDT
jgi:F-type H+-transporting ATPase subunit b